MWLSRTKFLTTLFVLVTWDLLLAQARPISKTVIDNSYDKSFKKTYEVICNLIKSKKWGKLNFYIHPEYGFYVYDNPGVRPQPIRLSKFGTGVPNSNAGDIILTKLSNLQTSGKGRLISGSLPVWDCGRERWNKSGNYCNSIVSCPDLVEHMLYSPDCRENPNHPEVLKAKLFSQLIKKHVIQTEGFEMYFALISGKWYIAIIDVCDKCSA